MSGKSTPKRKKVTIKKALSLNTEKLRVLSTSDLCMVEGGKMWAGCSAHNTWV